jgi:hypothetical protein
VTSFSPKGSRREQTFAIRNGLKSSSEGSGRSNIERLHSDFQVGAEDEALRDVTALIRASATVLSLSAIRRVLS